MPPSRKLQTFGLWGTIAYLASVGVYVGFQWDAIVVLTPHDLADSLSGVFAPLAFLWLVLGFYQQGDELRHSAKALYLQGEELANSVQQQRELVQVTREQIEFDTTRARQEAEDASNSAQPRFIITALGSNLEREHSIAYFNLSAAGPPCTELKITINGSLRLQKAVYSGDTIRFDHMFPNKVYPDALSIEVRYVDALGKNQARNWITETERNETGISSGFYRNAIIPTRETDRPIE